MLLRHGVGQSEPPRVIVTEIPFYGNDEDMLDAPPRLNSFCVQLPARLSARRAVTPAVVGTKVPTAHKMTPHHVLRSIAARAMSQHKLIEMTRCQTASCWHMGRLNPATNSRIIPQIIQGVKKLKPPVNSDRTNTAMRALSPIATSRRKFTMLTWKQSVRSMFSRSNR